MILSLSLCTEKSQSQSLVDQSAVLELKGVVIQSCIVAGGADVGSLSQLVRSEEVDQEETSKLELVLVGTEDILVE